MRIVNGLPQYHVVMTAGDGIDFIDQLRNEEVEMPELALIDIHMKQMDGFETVAYLNKNHPDIRCISISSDFEDHSIARIVLAGARAFLLKDTSVDILSKTMDVVRDVGFCHYQEVVQALQGNHRPSGSFEQQRAVFLEQITARESDFLAALCNIEHESYQEIGAAAGMSARTAEQHRLNLCKKFELNGKTGLILFALKWKLVEISGEHKPPTFSI